MKRLSYLLLFLLACIGLARFSHHQTKGFRICKIENNLDQTNAQNAGSHSHALTLLDQPFHYFNRGLQSFVFLSEDGSFVLKIFNNRYQRRITLYNILCRLPFCSQWAQKQKEHYAHKLNRTFTSYTIAANEFKEETALVYAHLCKSSDLPHRLTLIDPLNIAHTINPNDMGFIIQHRAEMAYTTFQELIRSGKQEELKEKLSSLIDFLILRCQKGIADNDPLIRTNFAFLNGHPVEIDVGPFSLNPQIKEPKTFQPEIRRICNSLRNWLNEQDPEIIPYLDQQLDDRLSLLE